MCTEESRDYFTKQFSLLAQEIEKEKEAGVLCKINRVTLGINMSAIVAAFTAVLQNPWD